MARISSSRVSSSLKSQSQKFPSPHIQGCLLNTCTRFSYLCARHFVLLVTSPVAELVAICRTQRVCFRIWNTDHEVTATYLIEARQRLVELEKSPGFDQTSKQERMATSKSLRSRPRQTRLTFTPLPSSSPAPKSSFIPAAVGYEGSPARKRRKLQSVDDEPHVRIESGNDDPGT